MKKIAPIAALALLAVSFTSCKKDYTCECKSTYNGVTTTTSGSSTGKMKKSDAEAACNKGDYTLNGITVDCNIK